MRRSIVYLASGALVWLSMLGSGIHATLAGILVAMIVPARPKCSTRAFIRRSRELLDEFEAIGNEETETTPVLAEPDKHEVVENLQRTAEQATTPLQLWERALERPVALFVLPLFALVNAGISVEFSALSALLADHPEQPMIAKAGILIASLLAGACAYLWLRLAVPATRD